jgi:hypothetical protein
VIWVAIECSHRDLSIFSVMSGSGAMSHPCDSAEGRHLVAKSHSLHPDVEQGSAAGHPGILEP